MYSFLLADVLSMLVLILESLTIQVRRPNIVVGYIQSMWLLIFVMFTAKQRVFDAQC